MEYTIKDIIIVKQSSIPTFKVILKGYYFKFKEGNGLYLSGGAAGFNTELINFYTNVRLVSSANPPISGRPVERFKIIDNETLEFYLPNDLPVGTYNLIYCNPIGYTKNIYGGSNKTKVLSVIQ